MGVSNKHRFGEAIPMSRADIAAGTLTMDVFDALSENEQAKCLTRDFIWKAPNIKKLKKESADMHLVYWQNEIRKALYSKPAHKLDKYQKNYVNIVTHIRDLVMSSDVIGKIYINGALRDFSEWAQKTYIVNRRITLDANVAVSQALFYSWTPEKVAKFVARSQFGYTEEEKIEQAVQERIRGFRFLGDLPDKNPEIGAIYYDAKHWQAQKPYTLVWSAGKTFYYPQIKPNIPGSYVVLDTATRQFLRVNLSSESLMKVLNECRDALRQELTSKSANTDTSTSKRKKKFVPELAGIKQENGADFKEIQPENYLKGLRFRGGEWGNWLNEAEREQNLTMCFNSFVNLCKVLNLPLEFASFSGTLSIAFGSRGHGSASAHFEPGNNVINLTKMKGAGCLAHEWGHALDHYITSKYEISFELATEARSAFMKSDGNGLTKHYIRTKDILPAEFFTVMDAIHDAAEFQKGSHKFDELFSKSGGGYWSSKCEMWARAFDCYVHDKLTAAGITDTYLSRGSDSYHITIEGETYKAYPAGYEREIINEAFDKLLVLLNPYPNEEKIA